VYVDLCGPVTPATAGGNKYFMLLVDDHSRWMQVFLLKSKDQAVEAFVGYKAEVENFTGCRIKTLRSDRGGEFLAGVFAGVCEQAGIKRQLTAPYTPQQNGVVEKRNRTVMEMPRTLLKSMKVRGKFWGESVRHVVYLLNRLPTKVLGDVTPYESWTRRKPSLGHLKMFGCTAHARNSAPHMKNLMIEAKL
jgi:transposase InsO family protein